MYVNEMDEHSRERMQHGKMIEADDFPPEQRMLAELVLALASSAGLRVRADISCAREWFGFKVEEIKAYPPSHVAWMAAQGHHPDGTPKGSS